MDLKITKNTTIYVACPPQSATGGPELLHQLVFKLNKKGLKSKIFYYPPNICEDPIHENYKEYVKDYAKYINDSKENILIAPETRTFILHNYKNIQKVIWWLSVDNYESITSGKKNKLKCLFRTNHFFNIKHKREHKDIRLHLVQSKYAESFLIKYGVTNFKYLSDYLRTNFSDRKVINKKKDWILYNSKKGIEFTQLLIEKYPDLEWKPIANMTPIQVEELISESKVYIDFGNHPGKDRLPRECAILYCCVITNKTGSANYYEDVPIPDKYKFADAKNHIPDIYKQIKRCIDNYETEIMNFAFYRNQIINQEKVFDTELDIVFNIDIVEKSNHE